MADMIKVTLVKSLIGRKPKHKHIAKQLRLRKINASALHKDIPAVRGLVKQIIDMVNVEEAIV